MDGGAPTPRQPRDSGRELIATAVAHGEKRSALVGIEKAELLGIVRASSAVVPKPTHGFDLGAAVAFQVFGMPDERIVTGFGCNEAYANMVAALEAAVGADTRRLIVHDGETTMTLVSEDAMRFKKSSVLEAITGLLKVEDNDHNRSMEWHVLTHEGTAFLFGHESDKLN